MVTNMENTKPYCQSFWAPSDTSQDNRGHLPRPVN